MKRRAVLAAVATLAGCTTRSSPQATGTSMPTQSPTPAPTASPTATSTATPTPTPQPTPPPPARAPAGPPEGTATRLLDRPLFEPADVHPAGTFAADVFAVSHGDRVYLVYEFDTGDKTPDMAISSSEDGITDWTHHGRFAIDDTRAQSFPSVVRVGDRYYCKTQQSMTNRVQLYTTTALDFPGGWTQLWDRELPTPDGQPHLKDAGIVVRDGSFWLVYATGDGDRLYGHITGAYTPLEDVADPHFELADWSGQKVWMNAQGFIPQQFGDKLTFYVHALSRARVEGIDMQTIRVNELTPERVDLNPLDEPPIERGPEGAWDSQKTHHCDAVYHDGRWLLYYDGLGPDTSWQLGVATW